MKLLSRKIATKPKVAGRVAVVGQRSGDRRVRGDRRAEVRYEPDKSPRRKKHGRRKGEDLWSDGE
jgi:hypothetical protein